MRRHNPNQVMTSTGKLDILSLKQFLKRLGGTGVSEFKSYIQNRAHISVISLEPKGYTLWDVLESAALESLALGGTPSSVVRMGAREWLVASLNDFGIVGHGPYEFVVLSPPRLTLYRLERKEGLRAASPYEE